MIKIPFKITEENKIINYKNRGMSFEQEINESNEYYKENNIALIYKKPTPIRIVKCANNTITEAYFEYKSTTDYCGVYKGKFIDFEAKSVSSKTSFPLSNIRKNQIEHAKNVIKNNGISFFFIEFYNLEKYFILFSFDLLDFVETHKKSSIPLSYFYEKGIEIKRGLNPPLDFIKEIETYVF